jgi:hypothetical protein
LAPRYRLSLNIMSYLYLAQAKKKRNEWVPWKQVFGHK